jgi:hypothetical protein
MNVSQFIEFNELKKANIMINDTIYHNSLSIENKIENPYFNNDFFLQKLNVLELKDGFLRIGAKYSSEIKDTTLFYSINY